VAHPRSRALQAAPELTDAEINAIADRLRKGEFLDDQYRDRLFRAPKEYELTYAGKESRGSILAGSMAVPLQTIRRFGDPGDGWANKLVFGDNLQVLKTLVDMKGRGELNNADGTPGVRLCYIDPPFATRQEFRGKQDERAYADKVVGARFVEFLRKRLVLIAELLSDDGTIYVHLDPKKGHYIKVVLDEIFGENNFRNEIIWWYYNKMQGNIGRFPSNHDCIYVYSRQSRPVFNTIYEERDEVTRLIKRAWDKDKQRLVNAKGPDGKVLYIDRDDKRVDDVWRLSMLQPADRTEEVLYPTQKPKTLLSLIVEASSKPGDLVLDCFAGSGTTALAADELDRRWIAVDSGKFAIYMAQRRLISNKVGRGKTAKLAPHKPFELCMAGLYDNDLLERLSFGEFEAFCLDLFGCRPRAHSIAEVPMSGTRKGAPVHFFPHDKTDALMGREYVESLADRLGERVSGSVCVVAPTAACDPGLFEDVIQIGKVSFFILRVPYSVIEALHDRRFEYLGQPRSAEEVNDPLDAYGFDFMQLPEVAWNAESCGEAVVVRIRTFVRGGLDPDDLDELPDAGREDLAMVMVDADYDGEVFRMSHWQFADELKKSDWSLSVPKSACGGQMVVVFLDTHGNERREILRITDDLGGAPDRDGVIEARA
jgi:DNA modification methylase